MKSYTKCQFIARVRTYLIYNRFIKKFNNGAWWDSNNSAISMSRVNGKKVSNIKKMMQYLNCFKKYKYFDMSFDIYSTLYLCLGEISQCQVYSHISVLKIMALCSTLHNKLKQLGKFKQQLKIDTKNQFTSLIQDVHTENNNEEYKPVDIKIRMLLNNIENGILNKNFDYLLMFVYSCICSMISKSDEKRSKYIKEELSFEKVYQCVTIADDSFMCIIDRIIVASTYTNISLHELFDYADTYKKKYDFVLYFYNRFNILL